VGRTSSQEVLNAVVAHEFGHALGIGGHSPNAQDVMFGAPTVSVPTGRDAQTLQFVLGERPRFTL
jgi:predicted Zn-dependent protease